MRLRNSLLICAAATLLLSGCASNKRDYVYLRDMQPELTYPTQSYKESYVQPDDQLNIRIDAKIAELAEPFNLPEAEMMEGYRVDAEGNINMPILGRVHVAGLTTKEVENQIAALLVAGNYLKDAMVTAQFRNFHYSVLGAVNAKGNFTAPGNRITLLEAIAQAGDLANNAMTDRVCVIREE